MMKVKTIESLPSSIGFIDEGWEFEGELVGQYFVITNGFFVGTKVHKSVCKVVEEEKVYTEKEWNDLKEHHMEQLKKEREQTATFQVLAREMTEKVKEKNKEVEKLSFFLECSKIALRVSCEAIETLKAAKS